MVGMEHDHPKAVVAVSSSIDASSIVRERSDGKTHSAEELSVRR
jgi:hypothetical protein